ncbi:hypothetical protein FIBSPDRAFT_889991 [Athelia psychrophila]|uniref:Uncharacterized protein n=1 Tax=Athelia psychrophila TaxID=1759441 RepID=A0A166LEI1_9AGAM|nr:hypothetical protein FIBSPDRAFT_889991 [Fibularhizoctonia sp. CBS 109695]
MAIVEDHPMAGSSTSPAQILPTMNSTASMMDETDKVAEFIEALDSYNAQNWVALKQDILKYYDADKDTKKYRVEDLTKLVQHCKKQRIRNLAEWRHYGRKFITIGGWLLRKTKINSDAYATQYWSGIPRNLRDEINAAAEGLLQRDQFDSHVANSDSDNDSGSDTDSESSDDSDDLKDMHNRIKKKARYRKGKGRLSVSQSESSSSEDDIPVARIRSHKSQKNKVKGKSEPEIESMIKELNSMSAHDPSYAVLVLWALKIDPNVLKVVRAPEAGPAVAPPQLGGPPPSQYFPPRTNPTFQRQAPLHMQLQPGYAPPWQFNGSPQVQTSHVSTATRGDVELWEPSSASEWEGECPEEGDEDLLAAAVVDNWGRNQMSYIFPAERVEKHTLAKREQVMDGVYVPAQLKPGAPKNNVTSNKENTPDKHVTAPTTRSKSRTSNPMPTEGRSRAPGNTPRSLTKLSPAAITKPTVKPTPQKTGPKAQVPGESRRPEFDGQNDDDILDNEQPHKHRTDRQQVQSRNHGPVVNNTAKLNDSYPKHVIVTRQSEITSFTKPVDILNRILNSRMELCIGEIMGISKEISSMISDKMKLRPQRSDNPTSKVLLVATSFVVKDRGTLIKLIMQCDGPPFAAIIDTGSMVNIAGAPFEMLLGRPWQRDNLITIDEQISGTYIIFKDAEEEVEIRVTEELQGDDNNTDRDWHAYLIDAGTGSSITEISEEDDQSGSNSIRPMLTTDEYPAKAYIDNVTLRLDTDRPGISCESRLLCLQSEIVSISLGDLGYLRRKNHLCPLILSTDHGFQLGPGRDPADEPYTDYVFLHAGLTNVSIFPTATSPVNTFVCIFNQQSSPLPVPWLLPYIGALSSTVPTALPVPSTIKLAPKHPLMRGHASRIPRPAAGKRGPVSPSCIPSMSQSTPTMSISDPRPSLTLRAGTTSGVTSVTAARSTSPPTTSNMRRSLRLAALPKLRAASDTSPTPEPRRFKRRRATSSDGDYQPAPYRNNQRRQGSPMDEGFDQEWEELRDEILDDIQWTCLAVAVCHNFGWQAREWPWAGLAAARGWVAGPGGWPKMLHSGVQDSIQDIYWFGEARDFGLPSYDHSNTLPQLSALPPALPPTPPCSPILKPQVRLPAALPVLSQALTPAELLLSIGRSPAIPLARPTKQPLPEWPTHTQPLADFVAPPVAVFNVNIGPTITTTISSTADQEDGVAAQDIAPPPEKKLTVLAAYHNRPLPLETQSLTPAHFTPGPIPLIHCDDSDMDDSDSSSDADTEPASPATLQQRIDLFAKGRSVNRFGLLSVLGAEASRLDQSNGGVDTDTIYECQLHRTIRRVQGLRNEQTDNADVSRAAAIHAAGGEGQGRAMARAYPHPPYVRRTQDLDTATEDSDVSPTVSNSHRQDQDPNDSNSGPPPLIPIRPTRIPQCRARPRNYIDPRLLPIGI